MEFVRIAAVVVVAYLLGSFPAGYVLGRLWGVNVLEHGSGRTGGTNVFRSAGIVPALLAGALDIGKGMLAVWLAGQIVGQPGVQALAGAAVILGHNYSIFLHQETSQLFAYVEIDDESRWQRIAQTEICKKWWAHMRDIMPSNPDNSPISTDLKELFHLD